MLWLLIINILGSLVWTGIIIWQIYSLRVFRFVGNFPDKISNLQQHTDPNDFSFLIMGDVKNSIATSENLLLLGGQDCFDFVGIRDEWICLSVQVVGPIGFFAFLVFPYIASGSLKV